MNKDALQKCMNSANVRRWHTMPTIYDQDVGNHTTRLMHLIMWVSQGQASRDLLVRALFHDVPEVDLGDIPFQKKRDSDREAENEWVLAMELPTPELSPDEEAILKHCDLLEMGMYAAEEAGRGNRAMLDVIMNVLEWFSGKEVQANIGQVLGALERWVRQQPEAITGASDE